MPFSKTSDTYTSRDGHITKVGDMVKWIFSEIDEGCYIITSIHKVNYKRNWRIRVQSIKDGYVQDISAFCFHHTYEKVS